MENKTKKRKGALRAIVEWVVYLAILAGLVFGAPKVLAKVLDTKYPIAAITSGSMWPALKQGDIVLIKGASGKEDIKIGDIVVYRNETSAINFGESFTIHRVIRLGENTFVTKGDANNVEDSATPYNKLVGKALLWSEGKQPVRIPYLGTISQILKQ